jgi:transcriptional regulator with XRE-family HTH domain
MANNLEPKTASHRVGSNVRTLRTELKMTQADLADAMAKAKFPVHLNTISKIERGDREISVDELEAFARVFGVSTESLLEDAGDPESDRFRERVEVLVSVWREIKTHSDLVLAGIDKAKELEEILRSESERRPDLRSLLDDALSAVGRGSRKSSVAAVRLSAKKTATKKTTTKKGGK